MHVSARIGSLPLKEPFIIARDTTTEAEVDWVEIEHEGTTGYGEAAPIDRYEESAESAFAYVEEVADSLGDDPFALDEIEDLAVQVGPRAGDVELAAGEQGTHRLGEVLCIVAERPGSSRTDG